MGLLSADLIVFIVENIIKTTGINPDDAQVISSAIGVPNFKFLWIIFLYYAP